MQKVFRELFRALSSLDIKGHLLEPDIISLDADLCTSPRLIEASTWGLLSTSPPKRMDIAKSFIDVTETCFEPRDWSVSRLIFRGFLGGIDIALVKKLPRPVFLSPDLSASETWELLGPSRRLHDVPFSEVSELKEAFFLSSLQRVSLMSSPADSSIDCVPK
mmetsp:Transcript_25655/g.71780  ORF Transcript_25655/g.71780 Transcript_25655/m.71780 type:complete len:162 (+) Transcript_25655:355-840(+)